MVLAGGEILSFATNKLTVFKPSEKAYEEIASVAMTEWSSMSHLVVTGGKLLVRTDVDLEMLTLDP